MENTPFVGPQGRCTGDNGGIISSFSLSAWDFQNNTYTIAMPGYEYVQGACAPLKSDRREARARASPGYGAAGPGAKICPATDATNATGATW